MNQSIKEVVYGKGTVEQIKFIAKIGGMNDEEAQMLMLNHEGRIDAYIMDMMGLSRKAFDKIEQSMRTKLAVALFECINDRMKR